MNSTGNINKTDDSSAYNLRNIPGRNTTKISKMASKGKQQPSLTDQKLDDILNNMFRKSDVEILKAELTLMVKQEVNQINGVATKNKNDIEILQARAPEAEEKVSDLQSAVDDLKSTLNKKKDESQTDQTPEPVVQQTGTQYQNALITGQPLYQPLIQPESRENNVVIHGLPEKENEVESRKQLNDLLHYLEVPFSIESGQVHIIKLGQKNESNSRPIKLRFRNPNERNEIFRNIRKLKDYEITKIRVSDDLTPSELKFREDLQCLASLCRDKGFNVKIKNDTISINDNIYSKNNLSALPPNISMAKAKTVELKDEEGNIEGIAFQGPDSPLSNFYPTPIVHHTGTFTSVEQGYVFGKALAGNDKETCQRIMNTTDPFELKKIGKNIISTTKWDAQKERLLQELMVNKFTSNNELKSFLKDTKDLHLFEAVPDRYFGCGYGLRDKNKINKSCPGFNRTGQILMHIRDQYIDK